MTRGLDNLKIYKLAEELEILVYKETGRFPEDEKYRSIDQLRRSSSSVTNNIAEGYGRYSFQDKISKFYITRGEAEETRKGLRTACKKEFISKETSDFFDRKYTRLIKQINAYINFLRRQKQKYNQSPSTQVPKYPSTQAFSLIEMLIVIGITAIIAGMVFANMHSGKAIIELNSNAEKLGAVIKQAQMNTLSGKWTSGSRPDGGYGVYITGSTYKLFADTNSISNHQYNDGLDADIQTFTLSNNVELSAYNHYFIIFYPPKAAIYIGTTGAGTLLSGSSTSLITLRHTGENRYAYVDVNAQGQIDVRKTP